MCSDIGTTSRLCAAYSFTGILFTVSADDTVGVVGLRQSGWLHRLVVRHWRTKINAMEVWHGAVDGSNIASDI